MKVPRSSGYSNECGSIETHGKKFEFDFFYLSKALIIFLNRFVSVSFCVQNAEEREGNGETFLAQ